jgi:hypothetical protein
VLCLTIMGTKNGSDLEVHTWFAIQTFLSAVCSSLSTGIGGIGGIGKGGSMSGQRRMMPNSGQLNLESALLFILFLAFLLSLLSHSLSIVEPGAIWQL